MAKAKAKSNKRWAQRRIQRAWRRTQGLCIYCGALAAEGQARCGPHTQRDREASKYYTRKDRERGVCQATRCANYTIKDQRYCDRCEREGAS